MMKYYIGIDLGGTNVRSALVDETGNVVSEIKGPVEKEQGPDHVRDIIINQIKNLDFSSANGIENVKGIGIGVPGPVNTVKKTMVMATNLPGFVDYPLADQLEAEFKMPVFVDNDANVAGLAEAILGAGKDYPTTYYITISTGIGGALIVNKQLVSGGRGHAGEIGNIIVKPGGYKFGTLNPGAVEAEASGTAITRKGCELINRQEICNAGDVFALADKGDEKAKEIVDEFVDLFTTALANIAHTVDPHCIVIGGGMMKSKDYFMDQVEKSFNNKIHLGMQGHIPLLENEIEDCGVVGAAMLPMSNDLSNN